MDYRNSDDSKEVIANIIKDNRYDSILSSSDNKHLLKKENWFDTNQMSKMFV